MRKVLGGLAGDGGSSETAAAAAFSFLAAINNHHPVKPSGIYIIAVPKHPL
jgi:hypothetical protein